MDLFCGVDGHGEPTVWQVDPEHPDQPIVVARRCDVSVVAWVMLTRLVEQTGLTR